MKKPSNWDNVKPLTERRQLPKGGYICKIMDAVERTYQSRDGREFSKFEISVDIVDGMYKGFFAEDYRGQTYEDKKWRGVLRVYIPTDDGSEKDEYTLRRLRTITNAIEDSNPGYHWDWDVKSLKDKQVGAIFRNEEWEYQGKKGFSTQCSTFTGIDKIRSGDFTIPKDRLLTQSIWSKGYTPVDTASDDDDLPF